MQSYSPLPKVLQARHKKVTGIFDSVVLLQLTTMRIDTLQWAELNVRRWTFSMLVTRVKDKFGCIMIKLVVIAS